MNLFWDPFALLRHEKESWRAAGRPQHRTEEASITIDMQLIRLETQMSLDNKLKE